MSASARHLQAVDGASAPAAVVPMVGDRAPRIQVSAGRPQPVNAHRLFYTLWYAALAMFAVAACIGWVHLEPKMVLNLLGGLFVALGGFGILVHTLWRPSERKLRHALGAAAALVLTIAALDPLRAISMQMRATARVPRLQPVAEALARDARIRSVGVAGDNLRLNGFHGRLSGDGGWLEGDGQPLTTLTAVLQRDGITRAQLQPHLDGLRRAGMYHAQRTPGTLLFTRSGEYELKLLYVLPGQPLPDAGRVVGDEDGSRWRSEPLGGGWYMLLRG